MAHISEEGKNDSRNGFFGYSSVCYGYSFVIVELLVDTEQKRQKVSEIKAGLEEAESLVLYLLVAEIIRFPFHFLG